MEPLNIIREIARMNVLAHWKEIEKLDPPREAFALGVEAEKTTLDEFHYFQSFCNLETIDRTYCLFLCYRNSDNLLISKLIAKDLSYKSDVLFSQCGSVNGTRLFLFPHYYYELRSILYLSSTPTSHEIVNAALEVFGDKIKSRLV